MYKYTPIPQGSLPTRTMQYSANLGFLFKESASITDRIFRAKAAGFRNIELPWTDTALCDLIAARQSADVDVVLLNTQGGDGELGYLGWIGNEDKFRSSLAMSVHYAKALGCKTLHLTGVRRGDDTPSDNMHSLYIEELRYASVVLESENIVGVIEVINTKFSVPNYFLDNLETARQIVSEVNSPNVRLLLDLFHVQTIYNEIERPIMECVHVTHHIQIAQSPGRHGPDCTGAVNYPQVFELLRSLDYRGFVGLEYIPSGSTEDTLKFLTDVSYQLQH